MTSLKRICSLFRFCEIDKMLWFVLNLLSYIMRGFRKDKKKPAIRDTSAGEDISDGPRRMFPVGPEWRSPGHRVRPSPRRAPRDQPPDTFFTRDFAGRGMVRRQSFVEVEGTGKSVAVLTSGGDAQGLFFTWIGHRFAYVQPRGYSLLLYTGIPVNIWGLGFHIQIIFGVKKV